MCDVSEEGTTRYSHGQCIPHNPLLTLSMECCGRGVQYPNIACQLFIDIQWTII